MVRRIVDGEPRRVRFARGWRNHHPLVLVAALIPVTLILIPLSRVVANGDYVTIPEERLLRQGGDDAVHISYTVSALKRQRPRQLPVYLVGGSATRESIVSERAVAREIRQKLGIFVEAHSLAGNSQSFADDLAIIENLPAGKAVIVIGVGVERFARSSDGLRATSLDRDLLLVNSGVGGTSSDASGDEAVPLQLLPGILRYGATYVAQHYADLLRLQWPWVPFVEHRYQPQYAWSVAKKRSTLAAWVSESGEVGGAFDQAFRSTSAELEQEVAAARQKGFTVLLVEQPLDLQIAGRHLSRVRAKYERFCSELAEKYDATYVDFLSQTGLDDGDFHDLSHLVASGWMKYQPQLVHALAPSLRHLAAKQTPVACAQVSRRAGLSRRQRD